MIAKVFLDGKDVFTLSSTGKRLIFRQEFSVKNFLVKVPVHFQKRSIGVFQRGSSVSFFMCT